MWTARKVNPRKEGDLFKVDVEIRNDGEVVKIETFETSQSQPANWPAEGAKRLIENLKAVPQMVGKVEEGDIEIPADPVIDTAAQAWLEDHAKAMRAKSLVDLGVIPANNAKYAALLARLKTNFRAEYIGLI
jgi:hypothetical protein